MKKIAVFTACTLLTACQTLTPTQDAQLACLGSALGAQLAANYANPVKAAQIQSDGTILCTFVTGAAIIVTPSK
jgi:hypothetical protein